MLLCLLNPSESYSASRFSFCFSIVLFPLWHTENHTLQILFVNKKKRQLLELAQLLLLLLF